MLIVVLLLLVILTMSASLLLEQSTANTEASSAVRSYTVAQSRAAMGVMQMRAQLLAPAAVAQMQALGTCSIAQYDANACPPPNLSIPLSGLDAQIDGTGLVDYQLISRRVPSSQTLMDGAGAQYRAAVINIGTPGINGRFFIVSTGFYGYTGSTNLREARVEVEVSLPTGVVPKPNDNGIEGT